MKNAYWLLILLFSITARGQNFRPFRPGASYEFSQVGSDTLYSLRLERAGVSGGTDSAYFFNSRVGPNLGASYVANCRNCRYSDNLFGGYLEVRSAGTAQEEYRLIFGDYANMQYFKVFVLRPRAPLNQAWGLYGQGSAETARVTARGLVTVLGQTDSVVTITSSAGKIWRLSKNNGLVEGPSLSDVRLRAANRVRQLVLSAVPGRRLGTAQLTPQAIYDFQPGDAFWYNTSEYNSGVPAPSPFIYNYNYVDSVLTRTASRTGDTLTYRIWHCAASRQTYGQIITLVVSSRTMSRFARGTGEYVPDGPRQRTGGVMRDAIRSAQWNRRPVWRYDGRYSWSGGSFSTPPNDSVCLQRPCVDCELYETYAVGLGRTNHIEYNSSCCTITTNLIGYRKGTETWGQTPRQACRPLATAASRPAATTAAFPNPFGAELSVAFTLAHAQAVALTLHDGLGRVVLAWPAALLPGGAQQVALPTTGLPAGVYSLHLRFVGEGRTEVLRVAKAQ
ncbi:hypothetical protein [Hymenobacter properus]|uniref:T9SS type A sorting domain-containing protein n=1 Tax=Hymenobacter properus TaxID=2791026 RepID=A0A931BH70_9BACT|nr:hypothetical protein [Hymenobacter properus]MBF9141551.1 hypothetical protein [Hymenobacter properus]MBR7720360.1 hypothetical protein [Microvirga sp. SRT04]